MDAVYLEFNSARRYKPFFFDNERKKPGRKENTYFRWQS